MNSLRHYSLPSVLPICVTCLWRSLGCRVPRSTSLPRRKILGNSSFQVLGTRHLPYGESSLRPLTPPPAHSAQPQPRVARPRGLLAPTAGHPPVARLPH